MDHEYFSDLLSAYLDKELTPEEEAMMTEHLVDCPECRGLLERLREADRLVEQHGALSGGDYWEQSAQAIEEKLGITDDRVTDIRPKKRSSGLWWKLTGVAASAAILAFIGLNQDKILRDDGAIDERGVGVTSPSSGPDVDRAKPDAVNDEAVESVAAEPEVAAEQTAEAPGKARMGIPVPVRDEEVKDKDNGIIVIDIAEDDYRPTPTVEHEVEQQTVSKAPRPPAETPQKAARMPAPVVEQVADGKVTVNSISLGDAEQNYKGSKKVAADVAADQTTEGTTVVEGSIDSWRAVRDNLLTEKESVSKPKDDLRSLTSGLTSRSESVGAADREAQSAEEKEAKLLEAWYNVVKMSEDSVERERGLKYLHQVGDNKDSPNRDQAKEYLRLLNL